MARDSAIDMRHDPPHARHPSGPPDGLNIDSPFAVGWTHRLRFTQGALHTDNPALAEALCAEDKENGSRGMIAVIDQGVCDTHPAITNDLNAYCMAQSGAPELRSVFEIPGGEQCKQDDAVVQRVLDAIDTHRICRKSTILCIGGGALLDAVGYAAGIGHRGVRMVRMPSTVLSQCDSGVGVKTGINRNGKKNFVGTFNPPWAVLCDTDLLKTLSDRDWLCGFSEIVKISLLRDPKLFEKLEADASEIVARNLEPSIPVIEQSALLHTQHITEGGDPFEIQEARPLDFGHWSAHKLEQLSDFTLCHGDAVAVGLALDLVYSQLAGIVDTQTSDRVLNLLDALHLPTSHPAMEQTDELFKGIQEFREHLGGRLTITLVTGVGKPLEVHDLDTKLLRDSVSYLMTRSSN